MESSNSKTEEKKQETTENKNSLLEPEKKETKPKHERKKLVRLW